MQIQLEHEQAYRNQVIADKTIIPSTPYKNEYKIWQDSIDEVIDLFGLYEKGSKEHIGWEIYACYNSYTLDDIIQMDGAQRTAKMSQLIESAGASLATTTMGAIRNGTTYGERGMIPSQGMINTRTGEVYRLNEYSERYCNKSVQKAVADIAPNSQQYATDFRKIIYANPPTGK
ncbi:hypothetical protein [Cellulosilyticum lentocellum]|uniref:Uncharacterized protein n=1 Tax=Cellulosilyticum lentocellum (strain ATCC 49066 / DSM 5427 / NCIMB 11756 / RHM5) TaxID=642492 RepID=F2JR96_CELLD|nr:hypothetical protein [Cellulosilyticum lentocellum]ADZ85077.1 hypothetical protein Clole_3387 [Cellulosilyticum lentocellum DSM 5427]